MNQVFQVHESTKPASDTIHTVNTHTPQEPPSQVCLETLQKFYKYLTAGDQVLCQQSLEAQISRFPDTAGELAN